MPMAKISGEAHEMASEEPGTMAETVDGWMERATAFELLRLVYAQDDGLAVHMPEMTARGTLRPLCGYEDEASPHIMGAQEVVDECRDEGLALRGCEYCYDERGVELGGDGDGD